MAGLLSNMLLKYFLTFQNITVFIFDLLKVQESLIAMSRRVFTLIYIKSSNNSQPVFAVEH